MRDAVDERLSLRACGDPAVEDGFELLSGFGVIAGEVGVDQQRHSVERGRVGTHGVDEVIHGRELRRVLRLVTLIEADGLENTGKDAERLDGRGSGELAKAYVFI